MALHLTTGANGNIVSVIRTAPALFVFCLVQIGIHLALILGAGKLLGFSRRDVLIASNANVGGESLVSSYHPGNLVHKDTGIFALFLETRDYNTARRRSSELSCVCTWL